MADRLTRENLEALEAKVKAGEWDELDVGALIESYRGVLNELEDLELENPDCGCPVVHEADCEVALEDEETDGAMAAECEEED